MPFSARRVDVFRGRRVTSKSPPIRGPFPVNYERVVRSRKEAQDACDVEGLGRLRTHLSEQRLESA